MFPENGCVLRWLTQEVDILNDLGRHSPGLHLGKGRDVSDKVKFLPGGSNS